MKKLSLQIRRSPFETFSHLCLTKPYSAHRSLLYTSPHSVLLFIMFLKFRIPRVGSKTAGDKKDQQGSGGKKGRFRRSLSSKQSPVVVSTNTATIGIEQTLTMTTSVDFEETPPPSEIEDVVEEPTIAFTEQEIMQNELNHMRKFMAKQDEVNAMAAVLEELKTSHALKLAAKEDELMETKETYELLLNEKEEQLVEVKTQLTETKGELNKVCSVLMECQHELHVERTKSQFRLW
jgi:hypothetical protein